MYTINMFIERYYHIILYNYLSLIIIAWNAGMVIAHIYIHIYIYIYIYIYTMTMALMDVGVSNCGLNRCFLSTS